MPLKSSPARLVPGLITAPQLAEAFAVNAQLIQQHVQSVHPAESLRPILAPQYSITWALGHGLVIRDRVLALLSNPPMVPGTERAYYARLPQANAAMEAVAVGHQLQLLSRGQDLITDGLVQLTPDDFKRELQVGERKLTVAARLLHLYFLDTYHAGQIELLSRAARNRPAEF